MILPLPLKLSETFVGLIFYFSFYLLFWPETGPNSSLVYGPTLDGRKDTSKKDRQITLGELIYDSYYPAVFFIHVYFSINNRAYINIGNPTNET